MGDLSENAEYHMAKQRQEFVSARLGQLKKRMAELSLVNMANIPKDRAAFGSTVEVHDSDEGREDRVQAGDQRRVGCDQGVDFHDVPDWTSAVGKKVGDVIEVVTPAGKRELEILKLTTIHDEA